jgi:hypothetical protein
MSQVKSTFDGRLRRAKGKGKEYLMNDILLNAANTEYQREIERKTRLESKALSYITIVSIISAISVGLSIYILSLLIINNFSKFIYLVVFFGVIYFSIITIIFSLLALRMKLLSNISIEQLSCLWDDNIKEVEGSLFKTLEKSINENIVYNKEIENYNELGYIFIWITTVFFIMQLFISFFILFGGF